MSAQHQTATSATTPSVDPQVQQWLEQRQSMLILLHQLSARPRESTHLPLFCQTLIDYLSLGHFSIYAKLAASLGSKASTVDPKLLENIATSTDVALDFNEKYTDHSNLEGLLQDLSHLGEHLAHRMDWEDHLIKPYLQGFTH